MHGHRETTRHQMHLIGYYTYQLSYRIPTTWHCNDLHLVQSWTHPYTPNTIMHSAGVLYNG